MVAAHIPQTFADVEYVFPLPIYAFTWKRPAQSIRVGTLIKMHGQVFRVLSAREIKLRGYTGKQVKMELGPVNGDRIITEYPYTHQLISVYFGK